jgi:hypothetical protein
MKKILLTLMVVAVSVSNVLADNFRVFYYIEGRNIFYNAPDAFYLGHHVYAIMTAPFKYNTEAKTRGAAFDELMKNEPNAVAVTIN